MYHKILHLLNVKPSESALVRQLFTIQFFLGIGTAFLFTSSLTMFLSSYEVKILPVSYILAACLLFIFNRIYSFLDERLTSPKLMKVVIGFSAFSILFFWVLLNFFPFKQLPLIVAGWYMIIYMLVGYAFWGMASIIFNVRESKRLFSIVGAGDIPAKMLGYFSVTAMTPVVGVKNLLSVSVISFLVAWVFLKRFQTKGLMVEADPNAPSYGHDKPGHSIHTSGFVTKFFDNRLVFSIALLSLVSYVVFSFIDFTFLSDIKTKFHKGDQIAIFIGIFFAVGRLLAIAIKLLFSSRMISRIGLANALLVTPLLLFIIDIFIIISGDRFISHLYIFGFMVLLTEILRSALQEPVFFILFQPLKPHDRLRGHLVAKGHTLPFALLGVGAFLVFYFKQNPELPIISVGQWLIALLLLWVASVFIIKKQYRHTLVDSLKKGYFTGAELFLNDPAVISLLLSKTEIKKPLEVIHSLNLLERSGYTNVFKLLLKHLGSSIPEIREYVTGRIIANNMTSALPIIRQQLEQNSNQRLQPKLIQAYYFLNKEIGRNGQPNFQDLTAWQKKAAMEGLLNRREEETEKLVLETLKEMSGGSLEDKLVALNVIFDCECDNYSEVLDKLLEDVQPEVYKKAIEAAGKVKNYQLLPRVVEVAVSKKAYPSLKRSIASYGDEIFSAENWQNKQLPDQLIGLLINTAGTVKGDNSTKFLLRQLVENTSFADDVVEALWMKKTKVPDEYSERIVQWATSKTEATKYKVTCYFDLLSNKSMDLLLQAIISEIKTDAQLLLKAFSMLYNREKVDRVIELMQSAGNPKISNAIEVLELTIPKKYFTQLNDVVELIDDVRQNRPLLTRSRGVPESAIIGEILNDNRANFSDWTRSIACYMILRLRKGEVSLKVLNGKDHRESYLFNETKNYVLSMLN